MSKYRNLKFKLNKENIKPIKQGASEAKDAKAELNLSGQYKTEVRNDPSSTFSPQKKDTLPPKPAAKQYMAMDVNVKKELRGFRSPALPNLKGNPANARTAQSSTPINEMQIQQLQNKGSRLQSRRNIWERLSNQDKLSEKNSTTAKKRKSPEFKQPFY